MNRKELDEITFRLKVSTSQSVTHTLIHTYIGLWVSKWIQLYSYSLQDDLLFIPKVGNNAGVLPCYYYYYYY